MKKLFYWVFATTLVCGEGMLSSCTNNSADNPVVTPRQRVINFEGIDNARDMGGLVMQDGRIVRFDMLVRSGKLAKATDADVANGLLFYVGQAFLLAGSIFGLDYYVDKLKTLVKK